MTAFEPPNPSPLKPSSTFPPETGKTSVKRANLEGRAPQSQPQDMGLPMIQLPNHISLSNTDAFLETERPTIRLRRKSLKEGSIASSPTSILQNHLPQSSAPGLSLVRSSGRSFPEAIHASDRYPARSKSPLERQQHEIKTRSERRAEPSNALGNFLTVPLTDPDGEHIQSPSAGSLAIAAMDSGEAWIKEGQDKIRSHAVSGSGWAMTSWGRAFKDWSQHVHRAASRHIRNARGFVQQHHGTTVSPWLQNAHQHVTAYVATAYSILQYLSRPLGWIFKKSCKVLVPAVIIFIVLVLVLNTISIMCSAAVKGSLAIFCRMPLHENFPMDLCSEVNQQLQVPRTEEVKVSHGLQKTSEFFEQILLTSRHPRLLPHSLAPIQEAFRNLRLGAMRSNLSGEQKSALIELFQRYSDLSERTSHTLQEFLSATTGTVDFVRFQNRLLVKELRAIDRNVGHEQDTYLAASLRRLAEYRIVWLPFGVEPFRKQQGIAARSTTRLKRHTARIKPKVELDISRAIELHGMFHGLRSLIEEFFDLAASIEADTGEEKSLIHAERDIIVRFLALLKFNIGDTEYLEQRITQLEAMQPIVTDAGSYIIGANLTLNNIKGELQVLDERLDSSDWLWQEGDEDNDSVALIAVVEWIEQGAFRLDQSHQSWERYDENFTAHVFSEPGRYRPIGNGERH